MPTKVRAPLGYRIGSGCLSCCGPGPYFSEIRGSPSIVFGWSCSSAMSPWQRWQTHTTTRFAARAAWSMSPASRGSVRPHWSHGSCAGSAARPGFSSAPATICPFRGRSARSATSRAACRRHSREPWPPALRLTTSRRCSSPSSSCRPGRRCSCSRTSTGPTTQRSTRSPCSAAGSGRSRRCSS